MPSISSNLRPVTKYAARAIPAPASLLRLLRRCIKIAATAAIWSDLPLGATGHPRPTERGAGAADGGAGHARAARAVTASTRGGLASRGGKSGDHHG